MNHHFIMLLPEWWLFFWCEKEHVLMTKTWLNSNSQSQIHFFKTYNKVLVQASLFDKVTLRVTFTLAFFISYSRLQLCNKKTLARVSSCKYWKIFEISYRTPKRQILLFLLDFYEILPLPSKYCFSYYIDTIAIAQPYENNNNSRHNNILSK